MSARASSITPKIRSQYRGRRPVVPPTARPVYGLRMGSSEPVSRPEFTAVDRGLLFFHPRSNAAGGPAQLGIGPQRKHHGGAIEIGLKTHTLLGWGHSKVECLAKLDRVQFADLGTDGRVKDLSFQQKCSCI